MNSNKITVNDIIPLKESFFAEVKTQISVLNDIVQEYNNSESLHYLEDIKKRFNSELQYFTTLYSKTKTYKGSNHTYLEGELKEIRSVALHLIMSEQGVNITTAERLLPAFPYYKERKDLITKIVSFFIKVEELYKRYEVTLQAIIQSVSIAGKDFANSQTT